MRHRDDTHLWDAQDYLVAFHPPTSPSSPLKRPLTPRMRPWSPQKSQVSNETCCRTKRRHTDMGRAALPRCIPSATEPFISTKETSNSSKEDLKRPRSPQKSPVSKETGCGTQRWHTVVRRAALPCCIPSATEPIISTKETSITTKDTLISSKEPRI